MKLLFDNNKSFDWSGPIEDKNITVEERRGWIREYEKMIKLKERNKKLEKIINNIKTKYDQKRKRSNPPN